MVVRLTPRGIPSGLSLADILNQVRKEAYQLKGKSANDDPVDDGEDFLNTSTSSLTTSSAKATSSSSSSSSSAAPIKLREEWEKWYPMEWIAWVTFGVPCGNPCQHWVTESVSEGPKSIEVKKKPAGRVDQRKKEVEQKTLTTTKSHNTTMSVAIAHTELAINARLDNLMHINLQISHAQSDEMKVSTFVSFFGIFISK